jgi:DNA-binding LacI/PurR family transcriptional regulator
MSDVARLAGVSESTVSRALSDNPLINIATRERIRRVAEEHGYVLDLRARNLRLNQSGTVAVVFPLLHADQNISDPFFLEMLGNLVDALSSRGYDLLLIKISATDPRNLARVIQERRPDGVLLVGQSTLDRTIEEIAGEYPPLVVWGAPARNPKYTTVGSDNTGGAHKAVSHLMALGKRKIAFFGEKTLPEIKLRYKGYRAALRDAGLSADDGLECAVSFDESASGTIRTFIDQGASFDAAFVASDVLAMNLISVLHERELRVPQDVAVVSFDDVTLASHYTPPLTTVRQNIAGAASLMVEKLTGRISGEGITSTVLPTELIVRASCGASFNEMSIRLQK